VAERPAESAIAVRPFRDGDHAFLARIAQRLHPGETASPRDPEVLARFFADLAGSRLLSEPGAEAFVAMCDGLPAGVIAVHPDSDYFTGHPRAYVDILVVAPEAEGKGVGSALMRHVEHWARDHDCKEVALDVFAGNRGARSFYERNGYRPDHIRMTKSLD
jgi:GNAT superfamily N-acetyltransferase